MSDGTEEESEGIRSGINPEFKSSTIANFDTLGLKEAQESNNPVLIARSLDVIPSNLEIWNRSQGGDVHDWWKLISDSSDRWDISVFRLPDGNIQLDFLPPQTSGTEKQGDIVYNSNLAELTSNKSIVLKEESKKEGWRLEDILGNKWNNDLPDQDDKHIVRGINDDEMRSILKSEKIQSRGDVVKSIGEHTDGEAWTFYNLGYNLSNSFRYAAQGRSFYMPNFSRPGFVISLPRNDEIVVNEEKDKIYSEKPIPLNQIKRIYELRPVMFKGKLSIPLKRHTHPTEGLVYSLGSYVTEFRYPNVKFAFKPVTKEEVKQHLDIESDEKILG